MISAKFAAQSAVDLLHGRIESIRLSLRGRPGRPVIETKRVARQGTIDRLSEQSASLVAAIRDEKLKGLNLPGYRALGVYLALAGDLPDAIHEWRSTYRDDPTTGVDFLARLLWLCGQPQENTN